VVDEERDLRDQDEVGVGPHPRPWPEDPRYDADLLRDGDRRNVVDRYRYWTVDAIVADLDRTRHPFHVAIENLAHDFNIGSVVRTANAFNAASVHVVGRRRWNRRGAMVTDRYLHVAYDDDAAALAAWAHDSGLVLVGVDNLPGAVPLETTDLQHGLDRAVRIDPFDQRRCRRRDRDARVGPPARLRPTRAVTVGDHRAPSG